MHIDLAHPVKSPQLHLTIMLKNAFLYYLGWLYVGFSEWTLRTLLEDTSPLAQVLDRHEALCEAASNWYFDFYIYVTVVCLWTFFTSMRQAYARLEDAPASGLLMLLIMSTLSSYGLLLSESMDNKLLFEKLSLLWQQSPMIKICALQSLIMSLVLQLLVLWVPLRSAFALLSKLFKRNRKA